MKIDSTTDEFETVVEIFLPPTLPAGEPLKLGLALRDKPPLKILIPRELAAKLRHFLLTQPIS